MTDSQPSPSGHVFLSYVREDAAAVNKLRSTLCKADIPVWLDTEDIAPGLLWEKEIQRAIGKNAIAFIACFSKESVERERSVQREELIQATREYRLRDPNRSWLIPVRLSDAPLPDLDIGFGHTLDSLQRLDLFGENVRAGYRRLIRTIRELLPTVSQKEHVSPAERYSWESESVDDSPGSAGYEAIRVTLASVDEVMTQVSGLYEDVRVLIGQVRDGGVDSMLMDDVASRAYDAGITLMGMYGLKGHSAALMRLTINDNWPLEAMMVADVLDYTDNLSDFELELDSLLAFLRRERHRLRGH